MALLREEPAAKLSAFAADIDELLLLMRLADVSELAPVVLAVHPNVYRPDDQLVVDLAVLPGLVDAGLVDANGSVDPQVKQWLRALQAPAAEIAIRVFDGDAVLRGAVVRRDELVVVALRNDDQCTVQGFRTDREDFESTVVEPLWRVLGASDPADFESLTLEAGELAEVVAAFDPQVAGPRGERAIRSRLREHDLSQQTVDILLDAARYTGRRAEIVYHRTDPSGVRTQAGWAVGVMDTVAGRVLSTTERGSHGVLDVTLSPGTRRRFSEGIAALVERGGCRGWFDTTN
ncbi:ESX secretion-associated protein EspG [Tsukamurella paurometabola]|uniref:ESX-1 secretion-associated protein EspG1 n=1 Tax=Tsukamurella paurometabola TaxID=2061 RepID=A0A3P8LDI3_TSUPA|nr:ESX secretion-associated protein EspG [Tsukamurella paurometabola]UEA81158.1 ESX secretion-associated protein EspG [Tsukamurella paurometabola]VDR38132.1 ESX-1 secretion-associated protein EspG1 [Tsukamurella paurometabola]